VDTIHRTGAASRLSRNNESEQPRFSASTMNGNNEFGCVLGITVCATATQETAPRLCRERFTQEPPPENGDDYTNRGRQGNAQARSVRYIQSSRDRTDWRRQSPRRFERSRDSSGWGRSRRQEQEPLNLSAQGFEPRRNNRDEVINPSGRVQDSGNVDTLNV
jgi:hypothetical protein